MHVVPTHCIVINLIYCEEITGKYYKFKLYGKSMELFTLILPKAALDKMLYPLEL